MRQLKNRQTTIFLACFTISIGLVSLLQIADLVGKANAEAAGALANAKPLMAVSPALVAAVCCVMSVLKSTSQNRLESYIMLVKQQISQKHFWPGYWGWENARSVLGNCHRVRCDVSPPCPALAKQRNKAPHWWTRLRGQSLAYGTVRMVGYFTIGISSLLLAYFLAHKQGAWGEFRASTHFWIGSGVTLASIAVGLVSIWLALSVTVGTRSFLYFLNCWEAVLKNCRSPFSSSRLRTH